MTPFARFLAVSLLALAATACGGPASDPADAADEVVGDALGAPCMSSASCGKGEVCTTQDGVCNPPPGCRPGAICLTVCYGTCRPATPPPAPCRTNADCRKFSDYCQGCNCRALSVCQKDPICTGGLAYCFADPCYGKEAYCSAGTCALRPTTPSCPAERCGPPLGMPSHICPDGKSVAGPTGRCLQQKDGSCGWEVTSCPDPSICPVRTF